MRLQVPFIQLPLRMDAATLASEITAIDEASWRQHPQGYPGNSMLPLVAVNGDPEDERFAGPMQPTAHLTRCPYLLQTIASLGVVVGRSRLMRLSGHAEVTVHVDQGYYWAERMRVHVPIVTQPGVRFECGNAVVNMAAGECWIFDTWRPHRVLNDAEASRVHLVVDTVGGDGFWGLMARGRSHDAPRGHWQPRAVVPGDPVDDCIFERCNVPAVIGPWELDTHLSALFSDTLPHPQLGIVMQHAGQLSRTWRALWARFGEAPEGRRYYRAAMDHFAADARESGKALQLRNDVRWFDATMTLLGKFAVSDAATIGDDFGPTDRG